MRVAIFSAQSYERALLDELNAGHGHELAYLDVQFGPGTVSLAAGFPAISVFVNDLVGGEALNRLAAGGAQLVATRSTGFNDIDLKAAKTLGMRGCGSPINSPNSVAEFGRLAFARVGLRTPVNCPTHSRAFAVDRRNGVLTEA